MPHDDGDPDDDRLASLRAAWRSMPDEEPPANGLAQLMAAARLKAEEMAPAREPWWQRVLATLRRPQVLALATIVLVAGGAVLIGRHRDGVEVPAVRAPATPPAREHVEANGGARDVAAPPPPAAPAATSTPPPQTLPQKTRGHTAPAMHTEQRLGADHGAVAKDKASEAQTASEDPGAIEQAPTSVQLHQRARNAAAAGDCTTARALVSQLQRSDASYYAAHVAGDAALAPCK